MKLRPFELLLVVLFIVLGITAMFLLSNYEKKPGNTPGPAVPAVGKVVIWGSLPKDVVDVALNQIKADTDVYNGVSYNYVSSDKFEDTLLRARANDQGPDLVIFSHEKLVDLRSRLVPISQEVMPFRNIQDYYVDGAKIFFLSNGLYAYPIAADPMLMYFNREILTANGYFNPPSTWESLVNDYLPKLTLLNSDRTIKRSVVAMGAHQNVKNSFEMLSTLMLQAGSAGVKESGGRYTIELNKSVNGTGEPFTSALNYYTRFGNSNDNLYSWNRSLSDDRTSFISGDLVFYFGYASEAKNVQKINPNFNFDVTEVPQDQNATIKRTYANFFGVGQMKNALNPNGAASVLAALGGGSQANAMADAAGMVSVFRGTVQQGSNDYFGRIAYQVTPTALGWLTPNPEVTRDIFGKVIDDVTSNRTSVSGAVTDAQGRLSQYYR